MPQASRAYVDALLREAFNALSLAKAGGKRRTLEEILAEAPVPAVPPAPAPVPSEQLTLEEGTS